MSERLQTSPTRWSARFAGAFPPDQIVTPRLLLRRPCMQDSQAIFDTYATDSQVTRYLAWRPHRSVEDTREFVTHCEAAWDTGLGHRGWIIERAGDGRLLGMIGVDIGPRGVNLGYVLGRAYWGQGYMTEAVQAVCDAALKDPSIYRVSGFCDVDNRASARVMEKAGMQYEGTLRRYMHHVNVAPGPRDCHIFARVR